jgi:2-polyprenyl-6-methoxyphenol hydroxylase-like FAD-dependent oxidoreductase
MPDLRVAIVGGGIGGLTLACCLRQRGIAFEGLEITPTFAPVGAGIALSSNAMAVMRRLGLAEALEARGQLLRRGLISDSRGGVLSETDLAAISERFGSMVAIHRKELHAVLVDALEPGSFRLGTSVESIRQRSDGLSLGSSDGGVEDFDVLVGADGIASGVRDRAVAPRERIYSGYRCWRFCSDVATEGWPGLNEMWGRGRRFGIVPLGPSRVYCFAVENAPRGSEDPAEGRAERLRENFGDFAGKASEILEHVEDADIHFGDIEELASGSWVNRRVALLGDAAHALTPNLGQGAAMAIEDAWVLAERLASMRSLPEALTTYESERKPRVTRIQRRSRSLGRLAQLEARPACAIRNFLTRLAPADAAQRALASFLETSPVIVGDD